VHRLLELLEEEVRIAMALAGARSLAELNRSLLHFGAPSVTAPHVHSAFPLLFPTPEAPR
jgi:isopentenyl diphosphate isomerase/L-lactate dehydrogenase-like FMN-dependent dehydrogenase